jgi:hypothetical protein
MWSGQRSARGLLAKPTTKQVMVYIRFFLYQGYDILFFGEAHCKSSLFLGSLSGYKPYSRFLCVGGRTGSEGRLAFGLVAEYLLSPTLSGGEAALPLHCSPT